MKRAGIVFPALLAANLLQWTCRLFHTSSRFEAKVAFALVVWEFVTEVSNSAIPQSSRTSRVWMSLIPFFSFLFLLLNNKNQGTFMFPRGFRLGACCLTILIYMFKECLRVRCDHATPTFPDFKA